MDAGKTEKERYFVINQRAYTTVRIDRGYLVWNVHIRRYEALNPEDLMRQIDK